MGTGAPKTGRAACGLSRSRARVVGGAAAGPGRWPWAVSLQLRGRHRCGGTLVSTQWVLSAAHCFQGPGGLRAPLAEWRAVLGRLRLDPDGGQELPVAELLLHPRFRGVRGGHDLALLRLRRPAALGPRVGPVCLPGPRRPPPFGRRCWVSGWGHVAENVSLPAGSPLQEAALPLLSPPTCNCLYSKLRRRDLARPARPGMVCAGAAAGGRGACQADSGGAVTCGGGPGGRWVQFGVLSFALGCARPNGPALATGLVGAHGRWLRRHLPPSAFVPEPGPPPDPHLELGICYGCGTAGGPPLPLPPPPRWPWGVSLRGGGRRCGGALLGGGWVLTAASCFIGAQDPEAWEAELWGAEPESHAPCPDGHAPCPDGHAPSPDGHAPSPDGHAPSPDGHAPSPDGHAPSPDGHAPSLDGHAPSPDGHAPSPDDHAPSPDGHAPSPDGHAPTLDGHAPSPDDHAPSSDDPAPSSGPAPSFDPTHSSDPAPSLGPAPSSPGPSLSFGPAPSSPHPAPSSPAPAPSDPAPSSGPAPPRPLRPRPLYKPRPLRPRTLS
ncbi:LOW QUALITY PROTEIN: serine protease 53-like [Lonchura striata]